MSSPMDGEALLSPLFHFLSHAIDNLETAFYKVPGSAVVARYVKSSHQDDPWRTLLEVILFLFVVGNYTRARTRGGGSGKHFIQFNEKEIDELVDEWTPEPLAVSLNAEEQAELDAVPVITGPTGPKPIVNGKPVLNLASLNFSGLAGNEHIKTRAIETLKRYGLGSCGPPGFYGTLDVHLALENDIADFLGIESAILYSQGFSTISSVLPAFAKRGDIIVADRGVSFAIQKGLQISRSTVRWFDHNDMNSLEEVLKGVQNDWIKRGKGKVTRRFIVTEGIFEKDGQMTDLPKLIDLKYKYKYRLILDETFSFGTVGRTGRGLTELYNVPADKVDMIIGSVANGLGSSGGFCAGSKAAIDHQRINGPSFVYSASLPALLAVSASEAINILRYTPSLLSTLQENIRAARAALDRIEGIDILSHEASPIIHVCLRSQTSPTSPSLLHPASATFQTTHKSKANPASIQPRIQPAYLESIPQQEAILQVIVAECLVQGVLLTKAKRLRGQEMVDPRPSIRLAISAAMARKDVEKAVGVFKTVVGRVLK